MKFNSQICTTKEQSERLLALGLKKETADMYYTNASLPFEKDKFHLFERKDYSQLQKEVSFQICPFTCIPAWSLHRLIEIYDKTCIFWTESGDKPYEAMISRIANKIKWGELNKEYLEE